MAQNVIVKGKDNPVVINFTFTGDFAASGLNAFTSVTLAIGGESYNTVSDPDNLSIESATELRLKIGDTTSLDVGNYLPQITGFSATYDDGFLLTGTCKPILPTIKVC
jgi:hypothetical protein